MPRLVLVLNSTYEPLSVCSQRRALILIIKNKAEILETAGEEVHSESLTLPVPAVIRLVNRVQVPHSRRRRVSRRAIFARDGYTCQYCGSTRQLTLDHVIPVSRGGATSWENVVTSCAPCNLRKGSHLPWEVGMSPRSKPRPPSFVELVASLLGGIPSSWRPYVASTPYMASV